MLEKRIHTIERLIRHVVGINHHFTCCKRLYKRSQVGNARGIDKQAVESVAHTHAARLGIVDNSASFLNVARGMEICVANSRSGFNHRHS